MKYLLIVVMKVIAQPSTQHQPFNHIVFKYDTMAQCQKQKIKLEETGSDIRIDQANRMSKVTYKCISEKEYKP